MPRLSVIVVSYNACASLRRCLASLGHADEVIVVDNASKDGSAAMVEAEFPEVRLVKNSVNRGFGAANNQGLDLMTGEIALLLNCDALAKHDALKVLKRVMEDESLVACGGRLEFPDTRTQASCANRLTLWALICEQTLLEKAFPRSRILSPYWETFRLLAGPMVVKHEIEQVMGACLCMRPVERFDERFFLYCEDTELCRRLHKHGKVVFLPGARFVHELGASSASRWEAIARYNRGKELYFLIHHGHGASVAALVLDRFGAALRLAGWSMLCIFTAFTNADIRAKAAMFLRVLTAPFAGPPLPADSRE